MAGYAQQPWIPWESASTLYSMDQQQIYNNFTGAGSADFQLKGVAQHGNTWNLKQPKVKRARLWNGAEASMSGSRYEIPTPHCGSSSSSHFSSMMAPLGRKWRARRRKWPELYSTLNILPAACRVAQWVKFRSNEQVNGIVYLWNHSVSSCKSRWANAFMVWVSLEINGLRKSLRNTVLEMNGDPGNGAYRILLETMSWTRMQMKLLWMERCMFASRSMEKRIECNNPESIQHRYWWEMPRLCIYNTSEVGSWWEQWRKTGAVKTGKAGHRLQFMVVKWKRALGKLWIRKEEMFEEHESVRDGNNCRKRKMKRWQ